MSAVEEPYHFSVEEFLAFCATDPDRYKRFELINGEIFPPMSEGLTHARLVERIAEALKTRKSGEVLSHGSVILDHDGMPLPDIYVVRAGENPDGEYFNGRQLDLAVEVAVSTLRTDASRKLSDYARGGVPEYWIVYTNEAGAVVVRRHSGPSGDRYLRYDTVALSDLLGISP